MTNCRKKYEKLLCDLPSKWADALADALCDMTEEEQEAICPSVKECETLTGISEWTVEGTSVCFQYTNEAGDIQKRCFDLNSLLDEINPKCLGSQDEWITLTLEQRFALLFGKQCECCDSVDCDLELSFIWTDVVDCLDGLKVEAIYIHHETDIPLLPAGYTPPCGVNSHSCNRSTFELTGNDVVLGDIRMNNDGGELSGNVTDAGTYICGDYENTPDALVGGTWTGSPLSRYEIITLTREQAIQIASISDTSNEITFALKGAIETYGSTCEARPNTHSNVTWIRITRADGTLLYDGCPAGNFVTINVCE